MNKKIFMELLRQNPGVLRWTNGEAEINNIDFGYIKSNDKGEIILVLYDSDYKEQVLGTVNMEYEELIKIISETVFPDDKESREDLYECLTQDYGWYYNTSMKEAENHEDCKSFSMSKVGLKYLHDMERYADNNISCCDECDLGPSSICPYFNPTGSKKIGHKLLGNLVKKLKKHPYQYFVNCIFNENEYIYYDGKSVILVRDLDREIITDQLDGKEILESFTKLGYDRDDIKTDDFWDPMTFCTNHLPNKNIDTIDILINGILSDTKNIDSKYGTGTTKMVTDIIIDSVKRFKKGRNKQ